MEFITGIFNSLNEEVFNETALEIFRFQYGNNTPFHQFADALGTRVEGIKHYSRIPFLPVSFFKTHIIRCGTNAEQKIFLSSGTTGTIRSRHFVADLDIYRKSLLRGFEHFYGSLANYEIFGLMPSPADNPDSSLVFMVNEWIRESRQNNSGFYLDRFEELSEILSGNGSSSDKQLVIGLSYALLDFAEVFGGASPGMIIMETGGMKGKRKEMIREELHAVMKPKFGTSVIHSEYGMTELLSQAYSKGDGRFFAPPWMKVLARDPNDPCGILPAGKTGCLNIIDLANFNSCSFIATEDLGKVNPDGSFEVLGRFDQSDVRGCNLMMD